MTITQPLFTMPSLATYETEFNDLLQKNKEKIADLLHQNNLTFDNLIHPLDELSNELHIKWSILSHLHNVIDTEEIREIYKRCLPVLTDYQSDISQNITLFHAFKTVAESDPTLQISSEKQTMLSHALRDFHLSGVDLDEEKKQHFRELEKKLSELSTRFSENVLDATDAWNKHIEAIDLLSGLPDHILTYAANQATKQDKAGWILTLEMPCYLAVISYADNRQVRREIYEAYITRASEFGDLAWDNTPIMQEILAIRHQLATLLGFQNYAELSLATKMLEHSAQVLKFLNDLAELARPFAQQEFAALQAFAKEQTGIETLEAWDIPYYSEKLQKAKFSFTSEELRPYFPEKTVLKGLFNLVSQLYDIHILPFETVSVWHPDVKCYVIQNAASEAIGYFYIDLYARTQKHGGAWMDDFCSRYRHLSGELQLPVAFLTCNFTAPENNQPALFTHDEVITLFHEFGHGLHHLLTQMDILDISGISGVEWDAVELPSQFMENFCWEKSVIAKISSHYETGEPLPDKLYEQLLASKNFLAAMQLARQLEFALFDFHLHLDFTLNAKSNFIQKTLDDVRKAVSVTPIFDKNRFQHSFSHVFAGGYAAGYYSYKWAEVLSCDVYELFAEHGVISAQIGHQFLQAILSRGGSDKAMNLFKAFRGREPNIEALLRASGLI